MMMQFVRTGPELILINPENQMALEHYLINEHLAIEYKEQDMDKPIDFHVLFNELRDNATIIFISYNIESSEKDHKFDKIFITHSDISKLMFGMLNHQEKLIKKIRRSARVLFLKTVGDIEKVIKRVSDDFKGEILDTRAFYDLNSEGAIIHFTPENIDKTLKFSELYPKAVYVSGDGRETYLELSKRSIRYVNVGMHNQFWYELNVKIYDSYAFYESHYERLMFVLGQLDIGVIAGETWGTDAAMSFWSVDTYNIRIFTYLNPTDFKEILLGLEYLDDGNRCVDFDLYYRKKKISWTDLRKKRKIKRDDLGMEYRDLIYSKLGRTDRGQLTEMEEQLKNTLNNK